MFSSLIIVSLLINVSFGALPFPNTTGTPKSINEQAFNLADLRHYQNSLIERIKSPKPGDNIADLQATFNKVDSLIEQKQTETFNARVEGINKTNAEGIRSELQHSSESRSSSQKLIAQAKNELEQARISGDPIAMAEAQSKLSQAQRELDQSEKMIKSTQEIGVEKGFLKQGESLFGITVNATSQEALKTTQSHDQLNCQATLACKSGEKYNCLINACMNASDSNLYDQAYTSCDREPAGEKRDLCRTNISSLGKDLASHSGTEGDLKSAGTRNNLNMVSGVGYTVAYILALIPATSYNIGCNSGIAEAAAGLYSYMTIKNAEKEGKALADSFKDQADKATQELEEQGLTHQGQLKMFKMLTEFWKAKRDYLDKMTSAYRRAVDAHTAALVIAGVEAVASLKINVCTDLTAGIAAVMVGLNSKGRSQFSKQKDFAEESYQKSKALTERIESILNQNQMNGQDSGKNGNELAFVPVLNQNSSQNAAFTQIDLRSQSQLNELGIDCAPESTTCGKNFNINKEQILGLSGQIAPAEFTAGLSNAIDSMENNLTGQSGSISNQTLSSNEAFFNSAREQITQQILDNPKTSDNTKLAFQNPEEFVEKNVFNKLDSQSIARAALQGQLAAAQLEPSESQKELVVKYSGNGIEDGIADGSLAAKAFDLTKIGFKLPDLAIEPIPATDGASVSKEENVTFDYDKAESGVTKKSEVGLFKIISHRYNKMLSNGRFNQIR